ncbi:MAG: hypothetical protein RI985_2187, partial [Chloroflexota bacterium]
MTNHAAIAQSIIDSRANRALVTPPSSDPAYTLNDAYAVAKIHLDHAVVAGHTPVGRKIGFTNPAAWASMNLNTAVWGYVYAHTV